jgi:hypothetical protein
MSRLESPTEGTDDTEAAQRTVPVEDGAATVSLPPDATADEAAAVAVAVSAHLTDRQRAAAAARAAGAPEPADPWRLVDRLDLDRPDRWLEVADGDEWRAVGRRY